MITSNSQLTELTREESFPLLENIGSGNNTLDITFNRELSDCCLFTCGVTLNGAPIDSENLNVNIRWNAGNCRDAATVFETCTNPDATFTFSNTYHPKYGYTNLFTATTTDAVSYRWSGAYSRYGYTGSTFRTDPFPSSKETTICLTVTTNDCYSSTHCETYGAPLPGPEGEAEETYGPGKSLEPDALSVYPNPFQDEFTVELSVAGPVLLSLYDAAGRRVRAVDALLTGKKNAGTIRVPAADLPNGLYVLRVSDTGGTRLLTKKLIKNSR